MTEDRKYGGGERKPLGPAPTWEQVLERNSIERLKREKPLHTFLEELSELARKHYLDIPEEDIVRLKWFGLYPDKPKVGTFMLRIKVPSGLLPPESVRTIGEISIRYGGGYAELSTREECLALAAAGIPFEVVPGVSSVVAAPAYAGIPLTHRGLSSSFAVVTASLADGRQQEFARMATTVDTLVVLMAAAKLHEVTRALIAAGRSPDEPAAVIASATTDQQLSVTASLEELANAADRAGIRPPATLVVGPVVGLSQAIGRVDEVATRVTVAANR
jgi:tetrapyrrole (corrin/porphyrin) methylase-like protein/nitrite/sulfite reductase ferredoxin-like protein